MASLFDKTKGMENITEILSQMEANIPHPSSTSQKLWQLRRATDIISHNQSRETMLEKAVAMLAENRHMPGWFNQCPTASGIGDSSRNRHSNIDLVHWSRSGMRARLVELKWDSDSPSEAVRQVLRYGAAYLFLPYAPKQAAGRARFGDRCLRYLAPGRGAGLLLHGLGPSGLPLASTRKPDTVRYRIKDRRVVDVP